MVCRPSAGRGLLGALAHALPRDAPAGCAPGPGCPGEHHCPGGHRPRRRGGSGQLPGAGELLSHAPGAGAAAPGERRLLPGGGDTRLWQRLGSGLGCGFHRRPGLGLAGRHGERPRPGRCAHRPGQSQRPPLRYHCPGLWRLPLRGFLWKPHRQRLSRGHLCGLPVF